VSARRSDTHSSSYDCPNPSSLRYSLPLLIALSSHTLTPIAAR
jgi:hypothetical protein